MHKAFAVLPAVLALCMTAASAQVPTPIPVPVHPPASAPVAVVNVRSYGATGSGTGDDAPAIQAAMNAAAQLSTQTGKRVKVFLPAGRYAIASSAPVIPSNIVLSGDTTGVSTILNRLPPNWQPFVMSTRDWSTHWDYLAIARADDTSAHPAVPGNSYQGLNYVYLHDHADAVALAALGVPASVQPGYAGLPIELATGATLSNNGNLSGSGPGTDPKLQMQDNGINPAPAVLSRILAVDNTGKVTLNQVSRFDWGTYGHGSESLSDYYQPSASHSTNSFVSGPAWIVPAQNYHHDIDIEHLTFEGDLSQTNLLYGIHGLYLGYIINVAVRDCVFQKMPSWYPILSIRAFNTLFERNQFNVTSYSAMTLDAGSGWTIVNNSFNGYVNPNAGAPGENAGPGAFIAYDEAPIDVTVIGNTFSDMPSGGKVVMGGTGGAYSRIAGNVFTRIVPPVSESYFINNGFIFDSNTFVNSTAALMPGSGATGAHAYNNKYLGQVASGKYSNGLDFYTNAGGPPNYFALNLGVYPQEFSYQQGSQYSNIVMASNTNFDGSPTWATHVLAFTKGSNGNYGFSYDWYAPAAGVLSTARIQSVTASAPTIRIGQSTDVAITLSAPASQPYPLYLIATDGERDAVSLHSFLVTIPAGQARIVLPAEINALKSGQVTISARSLFTTAPFTASTTLTVQ